jgi:alcohol dehydrogenase class IV
MSIELGLRKFVAPEIIFGLESRFLAGDYCHKYHARKVLMVTDSKVKETEWFSDFFMKLGNAPIEIIEFSNISPNPRDFEVVEGTQVFLENQCDLLLAIGGGSVLDCAKGIGILASNGGRISDYEGVDNIEIPIPPLICIPTTGGSSADVSQFAIINNTSEKYKMAIISKALTPDIALIDPFLLTSMDSYLTACSGLDALAHAFEAFVSNASSNMTDLYALDAIDRINKYLVKSIEEPDNIQFRGEIMLASMNAGLAFSNASLGCVHSLAHSLGGYLDLAHGECNGILLPHVVDYNFDFAKDKYAQIAAVFNINNMNTKNLKRTFIDYCIDFKEKAGLKITLRDRNVTQDLSNTLAKKAIADPCNLTNPRKPYKEDLNTIINNAI